MSDWFLSRLAIAGLLLASSGNLRAAEAQPGNPPRALPILMTESGRDYIDVHILQFDLEGPIFRHRGGIAKIPYLEIKEKTRKLLGYPMAIEGQEGAPEPAEPIDLQGPSLIPVRITTHWVILDPAPHRSFRPRLNPFCHHQAAWPFADPFRPFAAVDLMVTGGIVPHHGWQGPNWTW